MLRMWGPDVYDQWTSHRIPFNDPRVVKALDEAGQVQQGPEDGPRRHQGRAQHRVRRRDDAGLRQPAEVPAPPAGQLRHDVLPEERPGGPRQPGRHLRLPAVRGRLRRPGDPRWRRPRSPLQRQRPRRQEGHGVPHLRQVRRPVGQGRRLALAAQDVRRQQLPRTRRPRRSPPSPTRPSVLRFDGSDLMPKSIGSDVFWKEMVKWENGQSSQQTADNIEAAWPKS